MSKLALQNAKDSTQDSHGPPVDWSDKKGWDRYHHAECIEGPFQIPTTVGAYCWQSVRFLSLVKERGGRVWFPGCGIDVGPKFYASVGCQVLATDFSPFAIRKQRNFAALPPERMFAGWSSFSKESEPPVDATGRMDVAEHDFLTGSPEGVFDVVLNRCAFQGLSPAAMSAAAKNFLAALRPGGVAVIDTINVQGSRRNDIEDSLMEAGFFIPFNDSERWYRAQLENTGIAYGMIMGRPRVQFNKQNPVKSSMAQWDRDQQILDSFAAEYEARLAEEQPTVNEILNWPETISAIVVYPTG